MATTNLSPELRKRYEDTSGNPLAAGKLYTYQAGTTTPQATYTDNTTTTPHANPIILDANGEIAANVWLDPTLSYKFVLKNSSDVTQWTLDNVVGTLTNDAVATATIQDGAVTSAKIADDAITQAKLSDQVLGPDSIQNYSLLASVASNELTITLRDGTGAAPSASSPVKIPFRHATATTGTPVFREVTSAITATVSSGSTLGSVSAQANWIYVYALDNGGTVELAFSASKSWDEGSLQTTTAEGGAGAADSKTVLYANNARSSKAIRLIGRIKSTQATAGTWATAPSEISLFPFEQRVARSEVFVTGSDGYGSTNTAIIKYATQVTNVGTAITYSGVGSGGTNGDSFTINEDGLYFISQTAAFTAGGFPLGVSKNSSQLTTGIEAITNADRLFVTSGVAANKPGMGSCLTFLKIGDVIRSSADTNTLTTGDEVGSFRITKVTD